MTSKPMRIIATVFLIVGLTMFVTAGVTYAVTASFLSGTDRTTGTVVELVRGDGWAPVVRFTVDAETVEFRGEVETTPSAHDVGDSVTVAYDPDDPSDARIVSFLDLYLLPLIFGILGTVFAGFSVPVGLLTWRRRRRRAWLREHGHPVDAEITDVRFRTRYRVNGRHPLVANVAWRDPFSGRTHTAHSDHVWSDPPPALEVGQRVRVLVDPARPNRHLVELPDG